MKIVGTKEKGYQKASSFPGKKEDKQEVTAPKAKEQAEKNKQ